jgi:formyltetrahydrofolate deformylase
MRLTFVNQDSIAEGDIKAGFVAVAKPFGMDYRFNDSEERTKVLLMVSRFGHCLNDLLYRWKIGALPIDIVGVVSNHFDYQKVIVNHDIPFHHIKVTKENKPQAEARLMEVVEQSGAELIVLARYMQVLSDAVCRKMSGRIIGATAHYVTEDLDEGPIIEQDVARITHAQSADDYVSIGRDVESQVLARAVHAHIHHRVFMNGNKTIVFPPSPGSYASERMG